MWTFCELLERVLGIKTSSDFTCGVILNTTACGLLQTHFVSLKCVRLQTTGVEFGGLECVRTVCGKQNQITEHHALHRIEEPFTTCNISQPRQQINKAMKYHFRKEQGPQSLSSLTMTFISIHITITTFIRSWV